MADDTGKTPDGTEPDGSATDDTLGEPGKAALTAERSRAKAAEKRAKDAEAELQKLRDKDKSETERERDARTAADARAEAAELALLRRDIADEAKLPAEFAARLQGTTRDELLADAKALAKLIPSGESTETTTTTRPAGDKAIESLKNGGTPTGDLALNGDPIVDALKNKLGIRD